MNPSQSSNVPCPLRESLGCTKTFSRQQDAERHAIEVHGPSISCPYPGCPYTAKRQYRLRAHAESAHGIGGGNIYRIPEVDTLGGAYTSEVAGAPVQDLGTMNHHAYAASQYFVPIPGNMPVLNSMPSLSSSIGGYTYTPSQTGDAVYGGTGGWHQGIYSAGPPQYPEPGYQTYEQMGLHPPRVLPQLPTMPLRSNDASAKTKAKSTPMPAQGFASASRDDKTEEGGNGEGIDAKGTMRN